jgi:acetyl esterase/lipase
MFYPSIAPLFIPLVILSGLIIIRFSFMKRQKEMIVVSLVCMFIFIGAVIPYAAIPGGVAVAESQMLEVYGTAYSELDSSSMRSVPFSIYDSMYGVPIDESKFNVQYDIEYLDNGVDSFCFDWYSPVGEGPFPVIIAIHGGAWVMGNKGSSNAVLFNHYFASRGFTVFDLQYGLFDVTSQSEELKSSFGAFAALDLGFSPNYNGSYNIQQQIENIGYFTKILDLNSSKYQADMENVFVVGRSAGGNMASLVTLGHKNPLFAGNFSSNMTVRGGIWYYPASNLTRMDTDVFDPFVEGPLPIEEQYKKLSAASLISNSTVVPPIMIVHGDKDGLADYHTQGLSFYQHATTLGKKCLLITIPWAGHAFDLLFHSYGGQMSIYYIERFIALELTGGG